MTGNICESSAYPGRRFLVYPDTVYPDTCERQILGLVPQSRSASRFREIIRDDHENRIHPDQPRPGQRDDNRRPDPGAHEIRNEGDQVFEIDSGDLDGVPLDSTDIGPSETGSRGAWIGDLVPVDDDQTSSSY